MAPNRICLPSNSTNEHVLINVSPGGGPIVQHRVGLQLERELHLFPFVVK